MKRTPIMVIGLLALAALACSISIPNMPRVKTGPTATLTLSEAAPDAEEANLTLDMGAGTLILSGGGEGLLEGEVRYNVAEWKPTLTNEDGVLALKQGNTDGNIGMPDSGANVVNEWDLKLGDVPLNLTINAGAYQGTLDLSGVPLRQLSINDGASQAEIKFDSLNPEVMSQLRYATGASSVQLLGLANANFENISFKGGAGDYTLNFDGELQRDASVDISAGVSSVRIEVPEGMLVKVTVKGAISDVNTRGTWTTGDDVYETSGSGYLLTIYVDIGVGSLTLVSE